MVELVSGNPRASYNDLTERLSRDRSTVMRNIRKLKELGVLRRIGSKKTGRWEVSGQD
jgi:ATP-dependent DNA helicase RecG